MEAFDASSMIHAWDNYPIDQIPGLWRWMEREIKAQEFVISQVGYEEVGHKLPECADWLKKAGLSLISIEGETLIEAKRIADLLGIKGDKFHPRGVDENDVIIIASARLNGCRLISNEGRQSRLPEKMDRYKIPAVCALPDVAVPCINFLQLFKESKVVI